MFPPSLGWLSLGRLEEVHEAKPHLPKTVQRLAVNQRESYIRHLIASLSTLPFSTSPRTWMVADDLVLFLLLPPCTTDT